MDALCGSLRPQPRLWRETWQPSGLAGQEQFGSGQTQPAVLEHSDAEDVGQAQRPRGELPQFLFQPIRAFFAPHGEHFSAAGPLNISRSRQGQPVIFQAGDSEQGRDLGATIGEGIFTHAASIEQGQAFYTDLKSRALAKGRDPDQLLILPGVSVTVGDTDAETRAIEHELQDQGVYRTEYTLRGDLGLAVPTTAIPEPAGFSRRERR
jgi:alkanesulfonate monooxygenase SsuD/methylene tetrahydromethanopterin reductase-like flavin-dependent oxidoreductase (luciferase family)